MSASHEPHTWLARYDGKCPNCDGRIRAGMDEVQWAPDGTRVMHADGHCRVAESQPCGNCNMVHRGECL